MFSNPDMLLARVHDHQRALIAEADRYRLLAAARRARQGRRRRGRGRDVAVSTTVWSDSTASLNVCGQHGAAPAR
jgi:hypothetical protein